MKFLCYKGENIPRNGKPKYSYIGNCKSKLTRVYAFDLAELGNLLSGHAENTEEDFVISGDIKGLDFKEDAFYNIFNFNGLPKMVLEELAIIITNKIKKHKGTIWIE